MRPFAEYGELLTGKSGIDGWRISKLLSLLCPVDQYAGIFPLPDLVIMAFAGLALAGGVWFLTPNDPLGA